MIDSFEKVTVEIFATPKEGSYYAAQQIASLIKQTQAAQRPCVLGLATGSTPIKLYNELVRMHRYRRGS